MKRFIIAGLLILLISGLQALPAGEPPAEPAAAPPEGDVILNTYGFWRCYPTVRPCLFASEATDTAPEKKDEHPAVPTMLTTTPTPPPEWVQPDFDDHRWWRDTGPFFGGQGSGAGRAGQIQQLGMLCIRGKFTVPDPSKAEDLKLALSYRGGVVVYLNGAEAGRTHMPEGKIEPDTAAQEYPPEAFFTSKDLRPLKKEEKAARYALRLRQAELVLPAKLLKKGANVLALEVHRAPMKPLPKRWDSRNMFNFSTCGLDSAELRSPAEGVITPNTFRPAGVQVWNADLLDFVTPMDYGDPHETIHPIGITGTPNGSFSGQVVVSADGPLEGLKAEVSALSGAGGKTIPAIVRYPVTAPVKTSYSFLHPRHPSKTPWYAGRWGSFFNNFDTLLDAPPAKVDPVGPMGQAPDYKIVPGAVQPVWVTVNVPSDAAPGSYEGTLTVSAKGLDPVKIPIRLRVCGWKVPDPRTFSTIVDMAASPESLALYYKVPLWSDKHFALMEKSLELMGRAGTDVLYIPIIGETHYGNEHTMVLWTKKDDGTYALDFTHLERYLDLAAKHLGKVKVLCFHVWDYHLGGMITFGRMYSGKRGKPREGAVEGPLVSTSATETVRLPHYVTPEGAAVWKPLAEGLSALVKKRGLADAAALGMGGDILPDKEAVGFWKQHFPEAGWIIQGHGGGGHGSVSEIPEDLHGVPIKYISIVYGAKFALWDPAHKRLYGWKPVKGPINTLFARGLSLGGDVCPPTASRLIAEWNAEGGQRGMGRLMADFFLIPSKDRRGRNSSLFLPKRYPKCSWSNAGFRGKSLLWPTENGPVTTARYELLREGLQEAEARIFIEKALTDDTLRAKLGKELADRAQQMLDDRTRVNMWVFEYDHVIDYNIGARHTLMGGAMDINWYPHSGWKDRAALLYDIAAAVTSALK